MVMPLLAALDPRKTVTGTPFENVAEEVLNGLFCHYEPPVSEYTQHKAAKEVRKHPKKYTFSEVKKTESILRTSRLFRKRQALVESETPIVNPKKAVTWRDEKFYKGIEGKIEGCAANHCDFLGLSTKGGGDLTDNLSPSAAQTHAPKNPSEAPKPQSIIKQTPTTKEPLKDGSGSTRNILYDDEGNPIGNVDVGESPVAAPPAPSGLSQLRQMARELDNNDDVYEPENYDQPYNRTGTLGRSPTPRNSRPDDKISTQRSQSPVLETNPNHYDTPEQFEGSDRASTRIAQRPATPYRSRAPEENSNVEQESRTFPISPSKRSEVFSDLTMDPAINGNRYRAPSPANTSEGVEVDITTRGKPKSANQQTSSENAAPGQPKSASQQTSSEIAAEAQPKSASQQTSSNQRTNLLSEVRGRKGTVVYDEMGNIVEQRANLEYKEVVKAKSTKEKADPISDAAPSKAEESGGRSRRISEPDSTQKLQKLPSKNTVETNQPSEELKGKNSAKRDPTPRMSMEPPSGDANEPASTDGGPLPPTPRRKTDTRKSSQNSRFDREERKREEEIRARLLKAYTNESSKKKLSSGSKKAPPNSSKSLATDEEIRAEVTTAGGPETAGYPNPYNTFEYLADEPTSKEPVETRQDVEPAPSNTSTLSSIDEREPVVQKTTSEETAQKSKQSNSSNSNRSDNKLWKGWKKTIGQVKKIVSELDEQRLPAAPNKSRR